MTKNRLQIRYIFVASFHILKEKKKKRVRNSQKLTTVYEKVLNFD